ncbi:hypothetical protein B0H14DRAFT_3851096 [Mycena olivaceomarginata]|nr:hypothetical protein B0H14DRAFT_3851096 [Mycena olivaceomarginata]
MAPFNSRDRDEDMSFGNQILPVANLPADYEGIPEDGMQYLFTVRRDARHLPHVTRVPNPYEIPERLPPPSDDILPVVHPELPSPEWRTLFETRYKNFRKNLAQPTINTWKERDCWWAFLAGKPAEEWDPPKKPKKGGANKFQRGMRGFAEDDSRMDLEEGPSAGSSRDAEEAPGLETRPMRDDSDAQPQLPTPSGTPAPTESPDAAPIYISREPTPSLLRLIDQRTALHLLMYFHALGPTSTCSRRNADRVTQTHARWIFVLLSRVDDYISADDMHLLRNLARAYLALLKDLIHSKMERVAEDINAASCWLIISTVVGIWGQRDLWMEAEEIMKSRI